mmetsp:Transcript_16731/g.52319  ORF Transcript_16731/g.52319 Transcript_16731/m.52319 type:complete len:350 (-) Transcript_16731:471-1520(-)
MKKASVRSARVLRETSERIDLAPSKGVARRMASFPIVRSLSRIARKVASSPSVAAHIWSAFRHCRMSLPQLSARSSAALASSARPSSPATWTSRFAIVSFIGRRNLRSTHELARDRTFWLLLSLQMHTTGTLELLISLMSSAEPPRSPAPMPSTSSMITHFFTTAPPASEFESRFTVSRDFFDRASEAFVSTTWYPSDRATSVAIVDLPMPGGPEMSAPRLSSPGIAFFDPATKQASHVVSHDDSFFATSPFPNKSFRCFGLYLSAHASLDALALDAFALDAFVVDAFVLDPFVVNGLRDGGGSSADMPFTISRNRASSMISTPRSTAALCFDPSAHGRPSSSTAPATK